jgi:hypothetical protein
MASARRPGSGFATARRANKRTTPIRTCGIYRLTAWVRRGAVNVRVHMSVVEPACQDRHRGRAEAAAVDGAFVIAALPSRDTADDQPDDKQRRSNVHPDLRQHRRYKTRIPPSDRMALTLVVIREKPTHTCRQCPFQKSGSQAPRKPFAGRAADAERFGVFRFAVFVARAAMTAAPRCCRRRPAGPRLPQGTIASPSCPMMASR